MDHAGEPYIADSGRFVDPGVTDSERQYTVMTHLMGLLSLLDMTIIGPIVVFVLWRVRCRESDFIDDHGREAVNFQLSLLLYVIAGTILGVVLSVVTCGVGAVLFTGILGLIVIGLSILRVVGCVMGALAAGRREYFRYPMCIRFLKASNET